MVKVQGNELLLYDVIGPSYWGYISGIDVVNALEPLKGQRVTVRLNSPGGSVDEGVAIYNALKRHEGGVDVIVDSLAASMASGIAMAGETVTMTKGSRMMIHSPWSIAIGNAKSLRKEAEILDTYEESLIELYGRAKVSGKKLRDMLSEETWMTAQQAVDFGFADKIDGVAVEEPTVPKDIFQKVPDDVHIASSLPVRRRDLAKILIAATRVKHGLFDKSR